MMRADKLLFSVVLMPLTYLLWCRSLFFLLLALLIGMQISSAAPTIPSSANTRAASSTWNQLSQLKLDVWATEQGLPINTVQVIHQTRDGVLWVGTASGLVQFDGIRFSTVESSVVPDLASRAIFGLMEDGDGALWIGYNRGVAKYRNGRFELVIDSDILQSRRVWSFAEAADKSVWMATENGLLQWSRGIKGVDGGNGSVTKHYKVADGLPTERLRALTFDRDGVLWIATSGGGLVSMLPNKVGTFTVMNPSSGFPHLEVRHVISDPAGGVWAATAGGGLVRVMVNKGIAEFRIYTVADGLVSNHLTYLARKKSTRTDVADEIWMGTWGHGITRMRDGKFATLSTAQGLGGDHIWTLHVDAEGSVWAGTWNGGLTRLSRRAFGVIGMPEGLSNEITRAVIHDKSGVTWVTTAVSGVNRIEEGRVSAITKKDGLASNETSGLMEDRDGAIWVATYNAGVTRINAVPTVKNKLSITNFGLADGLTSLDVRLIFQDNSGTIWVGTAHGLSRFDGKRFVDVAGDGTEALSGGVVAMHQDKKGTIWIGTAGKGLVRLAKRENSGADQWSTLTRKEGLVSNWVLALHEDKTGAMWVGTNGEGMNHIKDGKVAAIRPKDGLWDGTVQVILDDGRGNLWMTCNRGFFYVPRLELEDFIAGRTEKVTSVRYGPTEALRSTTFASGVQPAGSVDRHGQLWLPSLKGVVVVNPKNLPDAGDPPMVTLSEVVINGKSQSADDAIVLPPGSAPITIRFMASTLLNANRVFFRYQLAPLSQDWVDAGKNREATFASLPHGQHQFLVAASLDGKRWQSLEQPLTIVVKPYFYQMAWFILLCTVVTFAAALGLFRLRTFKLHQRHDEMTRLVADKTEALRLANVHLSKLSLTDALTGLANRRHLDDTLQLEWRRAMRLQHPLAVIMVDIDFFKDYNDSLGHPEGDKCLIAVAAIIRDVTSRAGDFAARYGGEEFIILIPGLKHDEAMQYGEKLRQLCESRALAHPASSVASVVTISVGVATIIPTEDRDIATLVAEADAALYRAKREGRNMVR